MKNYFFIVVSFLFLNQNLAAQGLKFPADTLHEFRGVWVATTKRIDYPKAYNLSVNQLKDNYLELLNAWEKAGYNAVIFQVRPAADAFFKSDFEPWSEWITGKQGRDPGFDPLEFMVEQTHKRNIEFHAWFNPYRAVATMQYADVCSNHITKTKPEWFITYGDNKYFNPGIPEVRDYLVKIIVDVVKRYDIDGIHFDDYFYPYPVTGADNKIVDIPDGDTFKKYGGNFKNIADWRRNNVNELIKNVNKAIKKEKPWVVFGIAPYGVWRNKQEDPTGSNTRSLSGYDYLYADVLEWLKKDYVDYVAPQCYWPIGHKSNDFEQLVKWWNDNAYNHNIYIGLGAYNQEKVTDNINKNEIPDEIKTARKYSNVKGVITYRSSTVLLNPTGQTDAIKSQCFQKTCYIPVFDHLNNKPLKPEATSIQNKNIFNISYSDNVKYQQLAPMLHAVYRVKGRDENFVPSKDNFWKYISENELTLTRTKKRVLKKVWYTYKITGINRYFAESLPCDAIFIPYSKKDNPE